MYPVHRSHDDNIALACMNWHYDYGIICGRLTLKR